MADLGAYEHMCSSSGPNAKALHATRKLWTGLLDLEPSGLTHSQPLRQALLSLLAENPDINLGKHTGLVWAGEAELPPDTCQETWQGQQSSHARSCQAHQGPVPLIAGGLEKAQNA